MANENWLTPDLAPSKEAMKRKMAYALLMQGSSGAPVQHWTQALARAAQGAMGGYGLYQQDQDEKAREARIAGAITSLPGMSDAQGAEPQQPAPMSAAPMGNKIVEALTSGPKTAQVVGTGETIPLPPRNPLAGLDPDFRTKFADLRTAAANQGVEFNAGEGMRTPERQASLYAQGRTAPGPVVTQTLDSNHIGGRAMDVVPQNTDAPTVGRVVQALIANDPRFAGMRSGASFKTLNDPLHVEMPQNVRVASLGGGGPMSADEAALPPGAQPTQAQTRVAQVDQQPQARGPVLTPQQRVEISTLWQDPATRQLAMQKYQEYSKPKDQTVPLTDPKQRAAAGISPTDKTPYQRDVVTGKISPINTQQQITIDQRAESAFDTAAAKHQAERFDKLVSGGMEAKAMTADLGALKDIGSRITTGMTAELTAALGPYAEALGAKIDGLDDLQAYKSIVSKLAPRMRVAGSGATSDYEMRQFLEALPGLGKTPGGNEMIQSTLEALQSHKEQAAEIASQAMNKEITPRQADKMLRELPDPLTAWKKAKKTNTLKPTGTTKSGVSWSAE